MTTNDTNLAAVTIHVDETLDRVTRGWIQGKLHEMDGVAKVTSLDDRPHLILVKYSPNTVDSQAILACVKDQAIHAQLIGL